MSLPDSCQEFQDVLRRARSGESDAVAQLLKWFDPSVRRYLRKHVPRTGLLGGITDIDTLSQDVWEYFVTHSIASHEFTEPTQLLVYLEKVAATSILQTRRKQFEAQKRDRRHTVALEDLDEQAANQLAARTPSPEQFAIRRELWRRVVQGRSRHERLILRRLVLGDTHQEIAQALCISTKTIQRLLQVVRQMLGLSDP